MTILKAKFFPLCILTLFTTLIFLVSCEQNSLLETEEEVSNININTSASLLAPADIYDKGDEYLSNYLSTASEKLILKLHNNYIIAVALDKAAIINRVIENEPYGFHFSDIDLSKYLSNSEVEIIKANLATNFSSNQNVELRHCWGGSWECEEFPPYGWHCWCQW